MKRHDLNSSPKTKKKALDGDRKSESLSSFPKEIYESIKEGVDTPLSECEKIEWK